MGAPDGGDRGHQVRGVEALEGARVLALARVVRVGDRVGALLHPVRQRAQREARDEHRPEDHEDGDEQPEEARLR